MALPNFVTVEQDKGIDSAFQFLGEGINGILVGLKPSRRMMWKRNK